MPRLVLRIAIAAVLALVAAADAGAQCAMCRSALEQNTEVAAGFNNAILFLLAMPYTVFGGLAGYVLLTRRRRRVASERQASSRSSLDPARSAT